MGKSLTNGRKLRVIRSDNYYKGPQRSRKGTEKDRKGLEATTEG